MPSDLSRSFVSVSTSSGVSVAARADTSGTYLEGYRRKQKSPTRNGTSLGNRKRQRARCLLVLSLPFLFLQTERDTADRAF